MSSSVMIGIGIGVFLLLYMTFKLQTSEDGNNHFLLQLLLMFFIIAGLVMLGKATMDSKDHCSWNVVNSTVSGDTTAYGYDYQCNENTHTTSTTFYKGMLWFARIFALYILVYLIYKSLVFIGWVVPKGRRKR